MTLRSVKKTFVRNRSAMDPSVPRVASSAIVTDTESTAEDTVRLTFVERVLPSKLPKFKAGAAGDQTVESMSQVSDTVIELVFSGEVQGTTMVVQEGDAGIRTSSGGFVPAGSYDLPTFP